MDQTYLMNQWEIARTIDDVAMALDNKKTAQVLEAFSEDAIIHVVEDGNEISTANGKEAIRQMIEKRQQQLDVIFHNNGTRMIDVKTLDQAAVSTTNCIVRLQQTQPQATINQYQTYEDKMIKVNDFWYIVERTITIVSRSAM